MKKVIYSLSLILFLTSCKTDKSKQTKDASIVKDSLSISDQNEKTSKFTDNLLDLRDVDGKFNDNFKVKKFGMQKIKDSVFGFVFMLNDSTTDSEVNKYSLGIRGFDESFKEPFKASFTPSITVIENNKYVIVRRNLKEIRFFDSLDVYIYERKNWKKSGRLGGFKIRDIFFKEK